MSGASPVRSAAWALVAAVATVALGGCPAAGPLPPPMTLPQLAAELDSNNDLLPWLRASSDSITITAADEHGLPISTQLGGVMIYSQPHCFYMDVKEAGEVLAGAGANDELYWFWSRAGGRGVCWAGRRAHGVWAGSLEVPINPTQLTVLLGIDSFGGKLTRLPLPVLRSADAQRCYVIESIDLGQDHAVLLSELWYDRDTHRPVRVRLFDSQGRPSLESTLSDWRLATGSAGWFPCDVTIRWLDREGQKPSGKGLRPVKLRLRFRTVEVDPKFGPSASPRVFDFQARRPPDLPLNWMGPGAPPGPQPTP
ncbi:MAG: hypothetical protein BIFFINMI_01698 [Phycisphaerae bacterium]|nr:hypothetical protein [Phycisphaerae bacterium]